MFVPPADGVDFLRTVIRQNPGELIVVTLGMVTNLALAFRIEPGLTRLVKKIVMMVGAMGLPYAETNARHDPEALHIVVTSPAPFVLVPKDVTQHAVMSEEMLERLRTQESPWCQLLWRLTTIWQRNRGAVLPVLNDPLAVAIALFPDLAETKRVRTEVELRGEKTRGCTVITPDPTGNGEVVHRVDWQRFWALTERVLFSREDDFA